MSNGNDTTERKRLRLTSQGKQLSKSVAIRAVWCAAERWLQSFRVSTNGNALGDLVFLTMTSKTYRLHKNHNRETEIRSNRVSEVQSNGVYRDTDDTYDTDVSASSASVKTLKEAVTMSLVGGLTEDCLFRFARALKAFEFTVRTKLSTKDLAGAFDLWWPNAKTLMVESEAEDYDVWRFVFVEAFKKAKTALGSNSLAIALKRASDEDGPAVCCKFTSESVRKLVRVCWQLQRLAGDAAFFISYRSAAVILGTKDVHRAMAVMNGLVSDAVLRIDWKPPPGSMKAIRYKFIA